MKRIKVNIGDVFAIKLADNLYGFGQVILRGLSDDTFIAFDLASSDFPPIDDVVNKPIIFFMNSVSAPLEDGLWEIIGNAQVPENVKFSEYKVETPEGFKILSKEGKAIRSANKEEIKNLQFMSSYSPKLLEVALKAKYANGQWIDAINKIVYKG